MNRFISIVFIYAAMMLAWAAPAYLSLLRLLVLEISFTTPLSFSGSHSGGLGQETCSALADQNGRIFTDQ
jgi:hypothetical protein